MIGSIIVGALAVLSLVSVGYALIGHRAASRMRRELEKMAHHDPLTDLRNRVALDLDLSRALASRPGDARFAVILVRLDRFSTVNDHYGHDVGDQLLVAVSGQVSKALLPGESLFRLGGPEFVFICPSITSPGDALTRAGQIQQAINVNYRIDIDHVRVSASAGIVLIDERHATPTDVLDDADAALREAGRSGPGRAVVFEVAMAARGALVDPQERMEQALDNDEFLLMYLPVVQLTDSKLVGVEALLRWAHPQRGVVGAREIFEMLGETNLLAMVGDWVVHEACRHNTAWAEKFPAIDVVTTINVSPAQLADPDFIDRVLRAIELTGADPQRLCLEITEGVMKTDLDWTWSMLRQAKDAGIQLALDDFGTGYSTFDYIRRFSLDVLKIDQVFVERMGHPGDFAIVQQLVGMAHALDFVTIAEGVADVRQAEALIAANCDLAQGHYWSKAVPLDTIEKMIEKGTIRPGAADRRNIDWKAPAKP